MVHYWCSKKRKASGGTLLVFKETEGEWWFIIGVQRNGRRVVVHYWCSKKWKASGGTLLVFKETEGEWWYIIGVQTPLVRCVYVTQITNTKLYFDTHNSCYKQSVIIPPKLIKRYS